MCGRCFCMLEPEVLSKACGYKDSTQKYKQISWFFPNDKNDYKPSSNIGPRDCLPVITSGDHFNDKEDRILVPMLWGMVPNNWMDDPKKHKANTHNAKLETIQNTMYKDSLRMGCRCVVVVQGIYEWKTTGNDKIKQPYAIYMSQKDGVKIEQSPLTNDWVEEKGWEGVKILKLAGLFKTTKNDKTGDIVYSFTIITRESNNVLSWLHHRMPVILNNPEDEEVWLNHSKFSETEALNRITKLSLTDGSITWHPVSTNVNNVRNKQSNLMKPIIIKTIKDFF